MTFLKSITSKIYSLFAVFYTGQDKRYIQYEIGEYTYGKPVVNSWGEGATLKIGKFCSIASNVTILLGGNHRIDWVSTYPFSNVFSDARGFTGHPTTKGDVVIGHDVWIGTESMILSGVTIGSGAVIAACSVVTKDIPPYAIVAGNPAKIIRQRFDQETIESLLEIAWWDWPIENIKQAWPLILSTEIKEFIKTYQK
ncbi:MAG: CatB-related O-acetyltransferase [Gammaproteobacteria bacterium]|nr:CatB-related O-acetyltransferase [Gammaproteobacteria bacterium]